MKEKILLAGTIILALGLSISGVLLARGKMFLMSVDGLKANALLATASKDQYTGMAENWRGLAVFAQSVPSVLAWTAVLVISIGVAIAIIRFSFSMSRVHEERNKYLVNSGSILEKKLLGSGIPVRSLPFPVVSHLGCPDPDDGGLESDDPDQPEKEPYISRIARYVNR